MQGPSDTPVRRLLPLPQRGGRTEMEDLLIRTSQRMSSSSFSDLQQELRKQKPIYGKVSHCDQKQWQHACLGVSVDILPWRLTSDTSPGCASICLLEQQDCITWEIFRDVTHMDLLWSSLASSPGTVPS